MYEQPNLYNADCMEAMKEFPDKFFDLAIVDPPYGIGADNYKNGAGDKRYGKKEYESTASKIKKNRLNCGRGKLKDRLLNNSDTSWDIAPDEKYFKELFRVSRNQIIWGGNYFPLPPTRGIIVWDKMQSWENFSQVEIAWTSFDCPAKLFRNNNRKAGQERIHPTQKPIELYAYCLNKFANQDDKILDTHAGSATSMIACYKAGFEAWGFEIDEYYYHMAKQRLDREKNQVSFFEMI